jgi:transposase
MKLMPPAYVKPYVKRGKTDAADAEANCEAVSRPSMPFVSVRTVGQQAVLMLHKTLRVVVAGCSGRANRSGRVPPGGLLA